MANFYPRAQRVFDRETDELLDAAASRPVVAAGLRTTLRRLSDAGIAVLLVVDAPSSPFDPPTCLAEKARVRPCTFKRPRVAGPEILAAEGLVNVRLLNFTDDICGRRRCSPVRGDILVYRDNSHLTKTFALTLTPRFASALSDLI